MTRVLVAGVDTSTQSTKVRITDAATGEQVRFGQAKHPDGTSVNPEFWWEAFTKAAEQAGGLDDVAALAVGGQQHGMVILDKQGNVIRDAMLWNDTSSAPQAAALIDKLGAAPAEGDEPDDVTARGKQRWVKAVGSSPVASASWFTSSAATRKPGSADQLSDRRSTACSVRPRRKSALPSSKSCWRASASVSKRNVRLCAPRRRLS